MKLKIATVDVMTGETIIEERDETAAEKKIREFNLQQTANEIAKDKAQAEAKAVAQAKLAALGLTVEDLQALGL
jgi:hypothetical protein